MASITIRKSSARNRRSGSAGTPSGAAVASKPSPDRSSIRRPATNPPGHWDFRTISSPSSSRAKASNRICEPMTNHTGIAAGQYSRNPVVVRLPCSHRGLSHVPWKPNRYFFGAMSLVPGDRGLPSSYRPSAPASRGSGRRNRGSFVRTAAGCSARRVPPRCVPAPGRYTCARPGTRAPSTVAASATHLPDRPLANRVCSTPHCRSP